VGQGLATDFGARNRIPPFWWGVGVLVVVAFVLRLAYLREFAALPIFDAPVGDSAAHLHRAAEIARGAWLPSRPFYYCSIYYPYFLALVLGGFHGSLLTVALVQIIAGSVFVGLVAVVGRELFGPRVGLVAGALAALYGPSAFFEADILGVVWGQLALAVTLLFLALWLRRPAASHRAQAALIGAAGLSAGLASVERPNLLLVALVLAGLVIAQRDRPRLLSVGSFGVSVLAPLLVVLGLNVAGTGQWVPLTTSGGINLSLGYHEGATGTYDEPWEREAPEFSAQHTEPEEAMIAWAGRKLGHPATPQEASRYWAGQAFEYVKSHPRQALMLTARKALMLLNAVEIPNHLDFAFIRQKAPGLGWMFLGFTPILALAAVGLVMGLGGRNRAAIFMCALTVIAAMASVIPFTVADRYRAPMLPALFPLAGLGLMTIVQLVRDPVRRRDTRALVAVGAAGGLLAIAAIPLVQPLRGRDYWMFADAYARHGQMERAIASYEEAVRAEPENGELLNNLGNAYKQANQRGLAKHAFEQAIAAEPKLAYPHKSLGMLLVGDGQLEPAFTAFATARELAPDDAEAPAMMGAIRAEQANNRSADSLFAISRALAPHDPKLAALMDHYRSHPATAVAK